MIRSDTKGHKHEVRVEAYSWQRPTHSGTVANLSQACLQLVEWWCQDIWREGSARKSVFGLGGRIHAPPPSASTLEVPNEEIPKGMTN